MADMWSSGSDEDVEDEAHMQGTSASVTDRWSSASSSGSGSIPAMSEVVDNWSSASQDSSSQPSPNSQMVISPSHITLNLPSDILPAVLEEVPLFSEDFEGAHGHLYGPQDFGHLVDDMFEDSEPE
jgi:hypothetical protein